MALANDSVLVTPGNTTPIATHLVNAKEYTAVMLAEPSGHLAGSKPVYFFAIASTVHVAAASTLMWDLFNADAALIVRVLSIQHIVNLESAVTGVGFEWQLLRTTAVGTGGTGQTGWLADTTDTALDADITCRLKPTGGATASTSLRTYFTHSEETQAGNQLAGGAYRGLDIVPAIVAPPCSWKGIVLRQNQGLRLNQETNSSAGNSGWVIGFTVE
jgi:hypothetical protein